MISVKFWRKREGQTLIEILIGLGVAAVIIGGAVYSIVFSLSSGSETQKKQVATGLARELIGQVRTLADANWTDIYGLPSKATSSSYYVVASGTILIATSGYEAVSIEGESYKIFFSVENVDRDLNDDIADSGSDDPSTQKITAYIQWPVNGVAPSEFSVVDYITRWRTKIFQQDDWSGGTSSTAVTSGATARIATASSTIEIDAASGTIKLSL